MREKRNLLKADEPLIRVPKKREEEAEEGRNKKMEIGKWKLEKKEGGEGCRDAEAAENEEEKKEEEASWTAAWRRGAIYCAPPRTLEKKRCGC